MTVVRHLSDGMRVVVDQLGPSRVVAVSVVHPSGMRADPPGAAGLAHLAEHVSFGALAEHAGLVDAVGGSTSAETHTDHTEFCTVVPAAAVEDVLRLEARRMRPARVSAAELARQVRVLDEEIQTLIDGQDFAGHTVRDLPRLLVAEHDVESAHAGDGYGSAAALAHVTPADVEAFMVEAYRPGTAVVALAGDISPDDAVALVGRVFGTRETHRGEHGGEHDLPHGRLDRGRAGRARASPASSETGGTATGVPPPGAPERLRVLPTGTRPAGASAPAAVRGFVLPQTISSWADPHDRAGVVAPAGLADHLAATVALQAVAELRGLLCRTGIFEPLAARTPDLAFLARYLREGETPQAVAADVDAGLAEAASLALPPGSVRSLALRWRRRLAGSAAEPLPRAKSLARSTALFGVPDLSSVAREVLAETDDAQVARAAALLRTAPGALLHVLPRTAAPRSAAPLTAAPGSAAPGSDTVASTAARRTASTGTSAPRSGPVLGAATPGAQRVHP